MLSSVYITGSTFEAQDLISQAVADWRSLAIDKLQTCGLKVVNPLEFAWSGMEETDFIDNKFDARVRRALDLIDQSDALLANLAKSSYGTAMEMFYAYRRGKLVTVVGQQPFSPWVLSHSQARFGDIDGAVNYLIDEQPHMSSSDWALQYEALLSERYEQLPPTGEPDYKFLGGEIPVLAMAPHATAYWREGEFQEADTFTGSMTALLNRLSGCHGLFTHYCCIADPGWYLQTPMRRVLADIVKAGQIGLVVMLLGSSWREGPGLQISALGPNNDVVDDYAQRLKTKLATLEAVVMEEGDYYVNPLVKFIAQDLSVPAVVVRMHKRYRMPRLQMAGFSQVVHFLNDFVRETGLELARSLG